MKSKRKRLFDQGAIGDAAGCDSPDMIVETDTFGIGPDWNGTAQAGLIDPVACGFGAGNEAAGELTRNRPKVEARSSCTRELPACNTAPFGARTFGRPGPDGRNTDPSRTRSSARRRETGSPNRASCSDTPISCVIGRRP